METDSLTAAGDAFEQRSNWLLVARVGRASLHGQWLEPSGARRFDVLLSHYAPRDGRRAGDVLSARPGALEEYRPGAKIRGYGALLRERRSLLERYTHVALFDDDLSVDAATLTRLFEIAEREGYRICQPSLTRDSHFSYAAFVRQRGFARRHVTYIEMMCPVFRRDALLDRAGLFELGLEVGIDLLWCNWDDPGPRDHAIIDEVSVRHVRPVGTLKAGNGFPDGRTYEDDIDRALREFGIDWLPCVPYDAVDVRGRTVTGRTALLAGALGSLLAVPLRPGRRQRLRAALVHVKHVLFAAPVNVDVRHRLDARRRRELRRDADGRRGARRAT